MERVTSCTKGLPVLMDYLWGIAVLLWCYGSFLSLASGQNLAEEISISRQNNGDKRYTYSFPYDMNVEDYAKDGAQRNKPFHDIFSVKDFTGDTQRVHYAVDDHGIRANIHSNHVKFGNKFDTSSIGFGSRLRGWPRNKINTVVQNVPVDVQAPTPVTLVNQENFAPVSAVESPSAFSPLNPSQPSGSPHVFGIDTNIGSINKENKIFEEYVLPETTPSIIPNLNLPLNPTDLTYEAERVSRPNPSNSFYPIKTHENLSAASSDLTGKGEIRENPSNEPIGPPPTTSEIISETSNPIAPQFPFYPQSAGLNFLQDSYPNNENLRWYQSLPPVPPPVNPFYNVPFYPFENEYESQRTSDGKQSGSFILPSNSQNAPNFNKDSAKLMKTSESGIKSAPQNQVAYTNVNAYNGQPKDSSVSSNAAKSGITPSTQNQKVYPNRNSYVGSSKNSYEPSKIVESDIIPSPQNQNTYPDVNTYVVSSKNSYAPSKIVGSNVTPRPQNQETYPNPNSRIELQPMSYAPTKTENYSAIPMLQSQDLYQNGNPSKGYDKFSNVPPNIISRPEKQKLISNEEPIYWI
ncbi:uncharacterized protein CDAR_295301 [Caerostris darwini]|uniref:Uncharacterized protein n=1 Tax=Caerostris darwini TaxID=1538125 RepID=A0AAV4QYE0_9ARAC|nr:uncharacterized protein CDAR_295301 [Caerostris darwini]